jgi:hypothetical protein
MPSQQAIKFRARWKTLILHRTLHSKDYQHKIGDCSFRHTSASMVRLENHDLHASTQAILTLTLLNKMTAATATQSSYKQLPHKAMHLGAPKQQENLMSLRRLVLANKYKNQRPTPPLAEKCTTTPTEKRVRFNLPDKKRVQFAPTATFRYRSVISNQELQSMWYDREDYAAFDRERHNTISAVTFVNGDLTYLNPEKYSVRGLEQQLTAKQSMDRQLDCRQCKRVVLEQQHFQRSSGIHDPDTLQAVSKLFSVQASNRAYLRAVVDCHALSALLVQGNL